MGRLLDGLSIVLIAAAGVAFSLGMTALAEQRDLHAVYWLVVGGLVLKAASDMLRPHRGS
jgi:hypothetical protein